MEVEGSQYVEKLKPVFTTLIELVLKLGFQLFLTDDVTYQPLRDVFSQMLIMSLQTESDPQAQCDSTARSSR